MMEIFVNECSFHEQLHERSDLVGAFRQYFSLFALLNESKATYTLYHHENLFAIYRVTTTEPLIASLNRLPDKSLAVAIKNVLFNKLNVQDWQSVRLHSADDLYTCMNEVVTETSIAELAERKLQQQELVGLLLNFPHSKFADFYTIEVTKNESTLFGLDCRDSRETLHSWITEQLQSARFEYDVASTTVPTDLQTTLRDDKRFRPTTYRWHERRIYREVDTGYHWYVDNLHTGLSAHLEVFDGNGNHLGEAMLDGTLDISKRDIDKKLTF